MTMISMHYALFHGYRLTFLLVYWYRKHLQMTCTKWTYSNVKMTNFVHISNVNQLLRVCVNVCGGGGGGGGQKHFKIEGYTNLIMVGIGYLYSDKMDGW